MLEEKILSKDDISFSFVLEIKKNLSKAVCVASVHPVVSSKMKRGSKAENELEKFEQFVEAVKKRKSSLD